MTTAKEVCSHVLRWYRKANRHQRRHGLQWYKNAHKFCRVLGESTGYSTETVAGILAALSPQLAWGDNLLGCLSLVKTEVIPANLNIYPANIDKAHRILAGESPLAVLGGHKVRAFYCNVLKPIHSRQVTIDTHTARVAFNTLELPPQWVFTPKGNRILQQGYRLAARRRRMLPLRLQAIVWLVMRERLLRKPKFEQLGLYVK